MAKKGKLSITNVIPDLIRNLSKYTPLILIIFLVILRFYKSVTWFSFNFDEEYQAHLAWAQVKDFHPIWIGVSASNFGFYLGPAFTYLNALLFWISKGDLSILAYFSSFFGVVTSLSLYYVSSKIFSKKVGLIATVLYGFSALIIYFDHRFWNPTPIAFITIWLLYSFYEAQRDARWFILSAVLMASGLHVHLSLLVYWPLFIYLIAGKIRKIALSTWVIAILSYVVVVSPLIVFDITHNFDDLLGPFRFIFGSHIGGSAFSISKLIFHFQNIFFSSARLFFLNLFTNIQEEHNLGAHGMMTIPNIFLKVLSFLIFLWFVLQSLHRKNYRILLYMTLSIMAFYVLYPQWGSEYYLLSYFPLFFIMSGIVFEIISPYILVPLLSLFIIYNSLVIFTTTQDKYGLTTRRSLINQIMTEINGQPFSLEVTGNDGRKTYMPYGGWRYLFKTYGNTPVGNGADEYFGWIYPDEKTNQEPLFNVIIAEEKKVNCENDCVFLHSGAFNAYIFRITSNKK